MKHRDFVGLMFLLILLFSTYGIGAAPEKISPSVTAVFADTTPVIDGLLNDAVWKSQPVSPDFISYTPVYGESLNQKTHLWAAYDKKYLYFAFKCFDTEPSKIKTSIAQRDQIYDDDWVALVIDTMGNKQTAYEFYVNPSGIQADSLNSAVGGTDEAPDFVWKSAGKIDNDGYSIEIAVPLESIRFKDGKNIRMGVLVLRNISRSGMAGTWPRSEPGNSDFNYMADLHYGFLKSVHKLEVLPNFTYGYNKERESRDNWGKGTGDANFGASFKYGLTSSTSLETAVNPDFSQVESDSFQVEVNQRYPIFYSEKRPIFMEGSDIFNFGLVQGGMMVSAVNTRNIVDPSWVGKLSGSAGKLSFGLLTAQDRFPGLVETGEINPDAGKQAFFGILRGKYSLGSDNSVGFLYSGRFFAGRSNNSAGLDFQFRLFQNTRFKLSYLRSVTDGSSVLKGSAINGMFQYLVPRFIFVGTMEHYSKDFFMASAFQSRSGLNRMRFYTGPKFVTKIKPLPWLKQVHPFFQFIRLHDLYTGMNDTSFALGTDFHFTRQGFLELEYRDEKEAWAGSLFHLKYVNLVGVVQFFKWLKFLAIIQAGDQIYYDPENPFLGNGRYLDLKVTVQPDAKLNLQVEYIYDALYTKGTGAGRKFYSVDIYNLSTTYQFNKYFFLRGILRYDNFQELLLTDFLASFTLIPGTVIHLGYGSLYQRCGWPESRYGFGATDIRELQTQTLLNTKNSLFFKISYLWRIK